MSLRYTGEATMDQPALRDVERWKDKIEVRLDNRQVFFLFFGSAMVACMLFVLGVIVGKRLETRGRAEAPELEDPLAVLDRFGGAVAATTPAPLAFPRTLIAGGTTAVASGKSRAPASERSVEKPARLEPVAPKAELAEKVEPAPAKATLASTVSAPSLDVAAPTAPPPSRKLAALPRPLNGAGTGVAPAGAKPASVVAPTVKPAVAAVSPSKPITVAPAAKPTLPAVPASKTASPVAGAPSKGTASAPAVGEKTKGRFLLQLSSFQDRAEADAFARKFVGQNAYVVATEIPGKGTWYRVRVGSYGTMQEATAAKTNFERDHNVIAYVAGSGPAR